EVGGRLVVVLAGPRQPGVPDEVPLDQTAHLDRHVALALSELGGDLVQRHGPGMEVEEGEDAALQLGEDARGRRRRADPVDEDAGDAFHGRSERLEVYESSVQR